MHAGMLNHLVDICDPNETQAADGYPAEADAPKVIFRDVWANIQAVGGGEARRGIQIEAGVDSLLTIRFRLGVVTTYFLLERTTGRRFNIVKAADQDGRKVWLTCQCKEAVA